MLALWRIRAPDAPLLTAVAVALVLWTFHSYSQLSVALVMASLMLSAASLWSCHALLGPRAARLFLATAVALGWLAEQAGVTLGWFFGDYTYTEVLGPRVGAVPIVIPLMWFGLCYIGFLMSCLALWCRPAPAAGWKAGALVAFLAAMIVTAFDLGADPYSPGGPANLQQALLANGWDVPRQGLPCNQLELAYTLLTFSYVFLKGMRKLRMRLSKREEEAYLHTWNVAGHVLGIRADLMAHTMKEAAAMFKGIQSMARARPSTPDVRPALGRALIDTMGRSIWLPVIRKLPVPMTRWLIGGRTAGEIGVNERVGLLTRATFLGARLAVRLFDDVMRLVVRRFSLTRMFTRVVGYHLLTRFLLDQTRPLGLPDELLQPMHRTVAGWTHDRQAPGWVSRLEQRLTTTGEWSPAP